MEKIHRGGTPNSPKFFNFNSKVSNDVGSKFSKPTSTNDVHIFGTTTTTKTCMGKIWNFLMNNVVSRCIFAVGKFIFNLVSLPFRGIISLFHLGDKQKAEEQIRKSAICQCSALMSMTNQSLIAEKIPQVASILAEHECWSELQKLLQEEGIDPKKYCTILAQIKQFYLESADALAQNQDPRTQQEAKLYQDYAQNIEFVANNVLRNAHGKGLYNKIQEAINENELFEFIDENSDYNCSNIYDEESDEKFDNSNNEGPNEEHNIHGNNEESDEKFDNSNNEGPNEEYNIHSNNEESEEIIQDNNENDNPPPEFDEESNEEYNIYNNNDESEEIIQNNEGNNNDNSKNIQFNRRRKNIHAGNFIFDGKKINLEEIPDEVANDKSKIEKIYKEINKICKGDFEDFLFAIGGDMSKNSAVRMALFDKAISERQDDFIFLSYKEETVSSTSLDKRESKCGNIVLLLSILAGNNIANNKKLLFDSLNIIGLSLPNIDTAETLIRKSGQTSIFNNLSEAQIRHISDKLKPLAEEGSQAYDTYFAIIEKQASSEEKLKEIGSEKNPKKRFKVFHYLLKFKNIDPILFCLNKMPNNERKKLGEMDQDEKVKMLKNFIVDMFAGNPVNGDSENRIKIEGDPCFTNVEENERNLIEKEFEYFFKKNNAFSDENISKYEEILKINDEDENESRNIKKKVEVDKRNNNKNTEENGEVNKPNNNESNNATFSNENPKNNNVRNSNSNEGPENTEENGGVGESNKGKKKKHKNCTKRKKAPKNTNWHGNKRKR